MLRAILISILVIIAVVTVLAADDNSGSTEQVKASVAVEGNTKVCETETNNCADGICGPGGCPLQSVDLNLNIQQANRLKSICDEHTSEVTSLISSVTKERAVLASLMDAAKPDKTAVLKQAKKVTEFEAKIQAADIEAYLALKAILMPAQAAKLSAAKAMYTWSLDRIKL